MKKLLGNFYLKDSRLYSTEEFIDYSGSEGIFIYEVLRVISGVPLFLSEHLSRLRISVESSGLECPLSDEKIETELIHLIQANQMNLGNILMMFRFNKNEINYWFFQTPHSYPSESDYLTGVEVGILYAERINPVAKTVQSNVRERANDLIAQKHFYEVLLVDSDETIREGSRSNVFFIDGNSVITPPEKQVLNGITRQKTIEIINRLGIDLIEKSVKLDDIDNFDGIFITGTSLKILAVSKIEEHKFNPNNKVYNSIRIFYDELIQEYIRKKLKL